MYLTGCFCDNGDLKNFSGGNREVTIKTEEELRKQLIDVLTRLRAEIITKSIPDPGDIPASGGGQPSITGPGK